VLIGGVAISGTYYQEPTFVDFVHVVLKCGKKKSDIRHVDAKFYPGWTLLIPGLQTEVQAKKYKKKSTGQGPTELHNFSSSSLLGYRYCISK
jgi:hypothetical protein